MSRLAAVQSCYIPWKGYFDLLASVDDFVLYDDVQYTKNDWRNRNRLKTRSGPRWITIPVRTMGRFGQKIQEAEIDGSGWAPKHLRSLRDAYARAPAFRQLLPWLQELYAQAGRERLLSRVNELFIRAVCDRLGIETRITSAADYSLPEDRIERLVALCRRVGATEYLTGPAARGYLDEGPFNREGIGVLWMDYSNYPEYSQLWPPFEHRVTILDLLFNVGPQDALRYFRGGGGAEE